MKPFAVVHAYCSGNDVGMYFWPLTDQLTEKAHYEESHWLRPPFHLGLFLFGRNQLAQIKFGSRQLVIKKTVKPGHPQQWKFTLQIFREGKRSSKGRVLNAHTPTVLYNLEAHQFEDLNPRSRARREQFFKLLSGLFKNTMRRGDLKRWLLEDASAMDNLSAHQLVMEKSYSGCDVLRLLNNFSERLKRASCLSPELIDGEDGWVHDQCLVSKAMLGVMYELCCKMELEGNNTCLALPPICVAEPVRDSRGNFATVITTPKNLLKTLLRHMSGGSSTTRYSMSDSVNLTPPAENRRRLPVVRTQSYRSEKTLGVTDQGEIGNVVVKDEGYVDLDTSTPPSDQSFQPSPHIDSPLRFQPMSTVPEVDSRLCSTVEERSSNDS